MVRERDFVKGFKDFPLERSKETAESLKRWSSSSYLSDDFDIFVPEAHERANIISDKQLYVFTDQFKYGLKFPLSQAVQDLCNNYKIIPTMLTPNNFAIVRGVQAMLAEAGVPWNIKTFVYFCTIRVSSGSPFIYITPRHQIHWSTKNLIPGIHGWKELYCVIGCTSGNWGISLIPGVTKAAYQQAVKSADVQKVIDWMGDHKCIIDLKDHKKPVIKMAPRKGSIPRLTLSKETSVEVEASPSQPATKEKIPKVKRSAEFEQPAAMKKAKTIAELVKEKTDALLGLSPHGSSDSSSSSNSSSQSEAEEQATDEVYVDILGEEDDGDEEGVQEIPPLRSQPAPSLRKVGGSAEAAACALASREPIFDGAFIRRLNNFKGQEMAEFVKSDAEIMQLNGLGGLELDRVAFNMLISMQSIFIRRQAQYRELEIQNSECLDKHEEALTLARKIGQERDKLTELLDQEKDVGLREKYRREDQANVHACAMEEQSTKYHRLKSEYEEKQRTFEAQAKEMVELRIQAQAVSDKLQAVTQERDALAGERSVLQGRVLSLENQIINNEPVTFSVETPSAPMLTNAEIMEKAKTLPEYDEDMYEACRESFEQVRDFLKREGYVQPDVADSIDFNRV